jgi:hypothetical protein
LVYGRHGFFWSEHGGMRDLELLHGGFNSEAMGITRPAKWQDTPT